MTFPIGPREAERLQALHGLHILGTAPEQQFDAVCRTAQRLFGAPMALVTLVEQDRQWFKARCGLDVDGTAREVSFCTYAILSEEVFVVEDATRDERFRANPLVLGEPFIRFYAGAPLVVAPGIQVGTLCLIDLVPRSFSPDERRALRDLATIVVAHLRLHKAKVDSDDEAAIRRANEALILHQKAELGEQARALHTQRQVLDLTLEHMDQGLIMVDAGGALQVCNRRACELLGIPADANGSAVLPAGAQALASRMAEPHESLIWIPSVPGEARELEWEDGRVLEIRSVPVDGGGAVLTYTDITLRKAAERQLEHQARHDGLTGLPNRTYFREQLESRLAEIKRHGGSFAVMCLDLDRFKSVNDTLGHPAGDALLKEAARRLLGAIRTEDVLARFGGDEFVLLQVGRSQPGSAEALADRLVACIAEPFTVDGWPVSIGLSAGIAIAPDHGSEAGQLLKSADLALYEAKAGGRNSHRMARPNAEPGASA